MIARTASRRSKGRSICAVEFEPKGAMIYTFEPAHPSPTSAALQAVYMAAWAAEEYGLGQLEIHTGSQAAVRCCTPQRWTGKKNKLGRPVPLEGGGGTYACREDAWRAAWVIYWGHTVVHDENIMLRREELRSAF